MTIELRINAVRATIAVLADRLTEHGFKFKYPTEVFPGPQKNAVTAIERLEREVGNLSLALKLFWLQVRSVNFCGSHPQWAGCEYPDPLFVYPPSVATEELNQFLADKEERLRRDFPYHVPIAPDLLHKEDVSGGMWYNVSVPAVADDPPLNDEWHHTTFLNYLEVAVKWAGFPGLSRCPGHSWPLARLLG
jgi:hypothetical protein